MFQEVRKAQAYKSQLDMYKRQVQECQMKAADETKRADKAEFESNRHQEKLIVVQREKEVTPYQKHYFMLHLLHDDYQFSLWKCLEWKYLTQTWLPHK